MDVTENYVNPVGVGFPEINWAHDGGRKNLGGAGKMIEKEYSPPLVPDRPTSPSGSEEVDGRGPATWFIALASPPIPSRNSQNFDPTTRFLDTIHPADVWAAHRRVDRQSSPNLRDTWRSNRARRKSLISFMPTSTCANANLSLHELENLQRLGGKWDAEFPGRSSFVYFNQGPEWPNCFSPGPAWFRRCSGAIGDARTR